MSRAVGRGRGFTLLEVLVAVAILGLGLTVILSSQVGLFGSAQRSANLALVDNLARCRMGELEVKLLRDGFPLTDQNDEGKCCEDDDGDARFTCAWKVETVTLPPPASLDSAGDAGLNLATGDGGLSANPTSALGAGNLGAMGALASVQQTGGAALGDGGIGGLANLMTAAAVGGTQGMAPMLMSLVYPDLKPMLEASIRKVTVTVKWREGKAERTLDVEQYVTNPLQGGLDPAAAEQMEQLNSAMESQQSGKP